MMLSTTLLAILLVAAALIGLAAGYCLKARCNSNSCSPKSKCCDNKSMPKKENSSCCSGKKNCNDE